MSNIDYQKAYERQKLAREKAEDILENVSRNLYEANKKLTSAYEKLKDQKSQLLHQEKLASVGQLSAGIAHEINNPAGFIKSNLSSLQHYAKTISEITLTYQKTLQGIAVSNPSAFGDSLEKLKQAEEEADLDFILEDFVNICEESIDGADRITDIVNELKLFARPDADEKVKLDVNDCINSTVKLVNNEVKYKADLQIELSELPLTMGYPGNLSQVILNMIVNASHAIEEFGAINVRTHLKEPNIIIEIEDNGSGMDEETINHIFDPFFTTKDVGVGTGLGLSISSGIIKKHDGEIQINSEIGKGSCFRIILPVITPPEE